jgi:gamma-glutamyltranspeptidase
VRILVGGEAVDATVAAPRWVFDRTTLLAEEGLPLGPSPAGLMRLPMPVTDLAGHAHAISVDATALDAACDPRADGVAVGD